jgi:Family of unknown function (DUF6353)
MSRIPSSITKLIGRQALLGQKKAPEVLFVAGVIGSVTSTVLACRATLQLSDTLVATQNDLEIAHSIVDVKYTEKDRKKDVAIIYTRSVGKVAKLYAPSVLLGAASIAALTKSHNMLQERNLALTAAYAAVDKAFSEYRERVVDKYGEEEDRALRFPVEEIREQNEDGNIKTSKGMSDAYENSMYARFFDQLSPSWSKDPEVNFLFVRCQQNYANDLLKARGHIFLNEVYDLLGIPRTRAGSVVGWIISDNGDNYIDFGVFRHDDSVRDFVNGREGSILLDFNVDGVIWDQIDEHRERMRWQS